MPIPYAAAAAVAGTSLVGYLTARSNYRSTKKAVDYAEEFYSGYNRENSRFWADYRRAHHWSSRRQIKYPYRTGYYYNLSSLQNAGVRKVSSKNAVYRALAGGIVPFGFYRRSNSYGYVPYDSGIMYG